MSFPEVKATNILLDHNTIYRTSLDKRQRCNHTQTCPPLIRTTTDHVLKSTGLTRMGSFRLNRIPVMEILRSDTARIVRRAV